MRQEHACSPHAIGSRAGYIPASRMRLAAGFPEAPAVGRPATKTSAVAASDGSFLCRTDQDSLDRYTSVRFH
eukprot:7417814-Pyramimonas_sp.AAC.1